MENHHQMKCVAHPIETKQQRRWYVGWNPRELGYGGEHLLSQITGLDVETHSARQTKMGGRMAAVRWKEAPRAVADDCRSEKKTHRSKAALES